MVNNDETTARNAEQTASNAAGMCLQWSRQRAAIGSKYGDAATAWKHTQDRHPNDRKPPRGAMAYWTGGASGYGHIAPSVGGGNVRSTDSGGKGKVATVDVGWPERAWGLKYVGWAWDVNDVTIPHNTGDEDDDMGDLNLNQQVTNWSPDDGSAGKITLGKTLNQARGYSEDTYQRIVTLENQVVSISQNLTNCRSQVTACQQDLAAIKKALGI